MPRKKSTPSADAFTRVEARVRGEPPDGRFATGLSVSVAGDEYDELAIILGVGAPELPLTHDQAMALAAALIQAAMVVSLTPKEEITKRRQAAERGEKPEPLLVPNQLPEGFEEGPGGGMPTIFGRGGRG